MSTIPLVSVGIASYNNGPYLEELLESVRQQTYPAVELIIVDDCSTDNSAAIITNWLALTGYPATFIQHERNQGIVQTFSDCRAHAKGEYLSLVGSDDVLAPNLLAATIAEFERHGPECGAVYTDCQIIDSQGKEVAPSFLRLFDAGFADNPPQGNIIVPLLTGFYLPALTTTMRRAALDQTGEYDLNLFSEDLDMWIRLSRKFHFVYLPENLGAYRVHNTSAIHANRLSLNETYFRIYRKSNFVGPVEWAAARHNLADQAEHYYADNGQDAASRLWYAFQETKRIKLLIFWLLAKVGVRYKTVRQLLGRKPQG
ncbi:glycosyltransferase [Hymenobacter baengnokdamensis]|uniref:glycosyltransferase n=1 Tax=Hymenobacter baengnokdamensis TaxID=2615203 RepID=UPI00124809AB|nr:glycosyltransferase [Hymenobacter baengnokdamensis]